MQAVDDALGPMATVKRLQHYVHNKDYKKGGISPANTFNRVNHYIEETHGKADKTFKHEDGQQRDNKVHKELLKYLAAYEAVESFPQEFKDIKVDLELSIADAVDKSSIYFTTWMKNANFNAITKGHAVLYSCLLYTSPSPRDS